MKKAFRVPLLMTVLAILGSSSAKAAEPHAGLGRWEGAGTTFDGQGKQESTFTVWVTRTALDAQTLEMRGEVKLSTGRVLPLYSKMKGDSQRFAIETGDGRKGGGLCFGEGLCQSYEGDAKGGARATTTVVDGTDEMRLLITELESGRAVRFIRQTLKRVR